jgi:hypothetical protein
VDCGTRPSIPQDCEGNPRLASTALILRQRK